MISKILVYNPDKRPRPLEILLHPFFDELRDKNTKLPNGNPLPELFEFTKEEYNSYSSEIMEQLVPTWYKKKWYMQPFKDIYSGVRLYITL